MIRKAKTKRTRQIVKKQIGRGLKLSRRSLDRHPKAKSYLKRALLPYLPSGMLGPGYMKWVSEHYPDGIAMARLRRDAQSLAYQPLISVIVPTYNTDHDFLRDCLDSVISQTYENWQLCIADDASTDEGVREIVKYYANIEPRIKYTFLKSNLHIAGATNQAIKLADGEFIALFDHDDILWPNALYEVVKSLNENPETEFLYTDEDKISEDRNYHFGQVFKPDWNPDFLTSVNYITHFSVIKRSLFDKIGGYRSGYDGAQDWDLFLRLADATQHITHVPKVVYSWRVHDLSTAKLTSAKPYVVEAQRAAISEHMRVKGRPDALVEIDKQHSGYWNVTYPLIGNPLVSIVIPSKNQYKIVKRCIDSIYAKSTYREFEIILVDTGSTDRAVIRWYNKMRREHKNFKLVNWHEAVFSYSKSCNAGAAAATGELILMLNNDTEVLTPDWLQLLAGDAQRPEIGAVGCLLFFPDGYHVQHAGVGVGLGGVAANSFSMMTLTQPMTQTQHLMLNTKHNMTVVTAACMMIRKELFDQIGGFDEKLRVSYNDVDLCLRLHKAGYQNLYTPHVRLLHHESISVGLPEELKKRDTAEFKQAQQTFLMRWGKYIAHDPNLNQNLSKDNAFYDIAY